jgi:uncharacterized protein YgiM (DUF1202 family)
MEVVMVRQLRRFQWALLAVVVLALPGTREAEAAESKVGSAGSERTQPYVTTSTVNVRSGPGTQYKIVAKIESDTKINVAVNENGWLKVISKKGNPPGYIDEKFAKPLGVPVARTAPSSVQGSYTLTADTVVREGPGLHYKTVASIGKDKIVEVVGSQGEWLKVQSKHGRLPGYVEKKFTRPGAE